MKKLRIVFMGTPEFAVASLDAIRQSSHTIVGVVTATDKEAGRGKQISESAVKKYAAENELNILQPEKLRDENFLQQLKALNADLFVVVAFRMLPEAVWNMPPLGTINLHGSLLPQYRGAAPINRAVMNGEIQTGVTTFFLKQEIDTGNIIDQAIIPIHENETAGELHDEMMVVGARVLADTIDKIAAGEARAKPQETLFSSEKELKHAPKIFKEDCMIHWSKKCNEVHNHIRGLSPYPAAFTTLEGKNLKLFSGHCEAFSNGEKAAGEFETDGKTFLRFACADGWYSVQQLQLEGKKKMMIDEFLRGWRPASINL